MTTYIWPQGGDSRFAPKYLVGNVLAGDSNVAGSANGFYYIPDPGDGSGIALALTQPDGPGDVWIRPGDYTRTVPDPLTIPAGVRVQGAGPRTRILRTGTLDNGVFVLGDRSILCDLFILVSPMVGGTANAAVLLSGFQSFLHRAFITVSGNTALVVPAAVRVATGGSNLAYANITDCIVGSDYIGIHVFSPQTTVANNRIDLLSAPALSGLVLNEDALRSVIVGNILNNLPGTASAIDNAADYCTITSNQCVGIVNPIAGITVSGDNNVIVANVTGAATPVNNTGVGNEVAHNI